MVLPLYESRNAEFMAFIARISVEIERDVYVFSDFTRRDNEGAPFPLDGVATTIVNSAMNTYVSLC